MQNIYLCIDLKTFYASVECIIRNLDPFQTNLVVADNSRGNGAICLAITPKLKSLGIKNRCRLFEIPKHLDYICAKPQMELYMQYSAQVYSIYLEFFAEEDIHIYSIDEAFIDLSAYLKLYNLRPLAIAKMLQQAIYDKLGLSATVGLGTNLYLAKVALDILAKHQSNGIACLTKDLYFKHLSKHEPLSDFWQIGKGITKRLAKYQVYDMEALRNLDSSILYQEFGVNAKILIDHSNGEEPTTLKEIKNYESVSKSISNSQILFVDYQYQDAYLILKEMVDNLVLSLVKQSLVCTKISLMIGYSKNIIKSTNYSTSLNLNTSSYQSIMDAYTYLYQNKVNKAYPIRQIAISFQVVSDKYESYDLFTDYHQLKLDKQLQASLITIKDKYGKNSVLKGMNYLAKATMRQRNKLVGGHNAGES